MNNNSIKRDIRKYLRDRNWISKGKQLFYHDEQGVINIKTDNQLDLKILHNFFFLSSLCNKKAIINFVPNFIERKFLVFPSLLSLSSLLLNLTILFYILIH